MLGVGIISLFTIGLAGFIGSGGGESDSYDEEQETFEDQRTEYGDINVHFEPNDDLDPNTEDQINDFVEGVRNDPHQPIDDIVDSLHDFIDGLEQGNQGSDQQTPSETDAPIRPPTGDEFNDPRVNAEAADAQRILDEIAAEIARQPPNLVTVTGAFGSDVSDDLVLSETPDTADAPDTAYIVTAPDVPNDIEVGFDAEHTFQIEINSQTGTVNAGINSDIMTPEGSITETITDETDQDGVDYTLTTQTKTFLGSTDITLNIERGHIGLQTAQIDLSNPDNTLHFEFADDVNGNVHLVYNEVEQDDTGDTSAIRSLYVIETAASVTSLTPGQINTILTQEQTGFGAANILAEIYLGEDALSTTLSGASGESYEQQISNFINQTPQITSNLDWTSTTEHDENDVTQSSGGSGGGGSFEDALAGLDLPFTLPGFG